MAVQVSYLESKLYPPWFKTGPESVSSFGEPAKITAGTVKSFGEPAKITAGSVSSFRGGWPAGITAEHVGSKRYNWPDIAKREEVKTIGEMTPAAPSTNEYLEIGQPYFQVMVEGKDLGFWVKLDNLSMKLEIAEHRTGDGMNYRWIEPTIANWSTIKLSRAATAKGCKQTLAWLIDAQSGWKKGMTAGIIAKPMWHRAEPATYFNIGLVDVMPVSWSTNGFATDGKLAMETLELAFSGFERPEVSPPFPTAPPAYDGRKEPTPPAPPPAKSLTELAGFKAMKAPPPSGL
jgi:hypothetical protein